METKLTFATPVFHPSALPHSRHIIDHPHPLFPLSPLTSDGQPRTPASTISPRGSPFILDFADLIDPTVLMSPSPRPPPVHLPQTYNYGSDQYQASVSQKRSTASPGQGYHHHHTHSMSHYQSKALDSNTPPHQSILPPLRTPDSAQPGYHYVYPSFGYPYQYPQYSPGYKSYGYTHNHSQLSYSYSHHSPYTSASTAPSDLYTPNSAASYTYTTVQPSAAFGGWNQDAPRRDSTTVSGTIVGAGDDSHPDRRPSASSLSEREDGRWHVKPSPAVSPGASSTSEMGPLNTAPLLPPPAGIPQELVAYRQAAIMYTTDCEVKQTSELKRMCFNCAAKSPPSWRKSVLNPGRILCNKCGIFERTHNRARPPQNDDQKLRKAAPSAYRREIPSPLSVRGGAESPLLSPYSTVPSQSTPPISSTMSHFTFPAQPQAVNAQSMTEAATQLESSSMSSTSSSSLQTAGSISQRRHSQAHVHTHASRGPYAEAYARRGASYNTTPTLPSSRTASSPNAPASITPPPYWHPGRRHSDAFVHAHPSHYDSSITIPPPPPP